MTLDELRVPGWHLWRSQVVPLVYGRKLMTSPPVVVRAPTVESLREQIEAEMAYREQRWG